MLQLITDTKERVWNVQHVEHFYVEPYTSDRYVVKAKLSTTDQSHNLYVAPNEMVANELLRHITRAALDGKSAVDVLQIEADIRRERPSLFE